jgi:hypothetical protein
MGGVSKVLITEKKQEIYDLQDPINYSNQWWVGTSMALHMLVLQSNAGVLIVEQ